MTVAFLILSAAAFLAVVAGGVIDNRHWRKTLDTPPVTGYQGPERRIERTVDFKRPAKYARHRDVYDYREVDA